MQYTAKSTSSWAIRDRTEVQAVSFYLLEALRFLSERLQSRNDTTV